MRVGCEEPHDGDLLYGEGDEQDTGEQNNGASRGRDVTLLEAAAKRKKNEKRQVRNECGGDGATRLGEADSGGDGGPEKDSHGEGKQAFFDTVGTLGEVPVPVVTDGEDGPCEAEREGESDLEVSGLMVWIHKRAALSGCCGIGRDREEDLVERA